MKFQVSCPEGSEVLNNTFVNVSHIKFTDGPTVIEGVTVFPSGDPGIVFATVRATGWARLWTAVARWCLRRAQ